MVPTAPQQWGVEFRAHCYVSFPKVDSIRLVDMSSGDYSQHDQQPPSSGQSSASQIYSSSGDASRSLDQTNGLFPVDLDLTGFSPNSGTDVSNTYRNRGGRYVPRYSFRSEYNPTKVEWEEVRLFVGNQTNDLLEFSLPLRGECDVPSQGGACVDNLYKRDVLLSTLDGTMKSFSPEEHINTVMSAISQKYNWVAGDSKNPSHLKFNYFFVGRDLASGLKVASSEGLEKTIKTSFNMRRSVNLNHNYVAGGCSADYSTTMSSYVDFKMAEVLHYLTNDLQVETLCNDGSLPFGGRFSVKYQEEALNTSHFTHENGNHLDLRYFSDQDCSAFEGSDVTTCNSSSYGNFKNYYDFDHAARRKQDWDRSNEFLTALNALPAAVKQQCLSDSNTCADAMAAADTGSGTLPEKSAKAQMNLNAMLRLGKWTKYNRRKWTDVTKKFDGLFVTYTPGISSWQERLILDGKVSGMGVLESSGVGLSLIGDCESDAACDLHVVGSKKNLKTAPGHLNHLHLGY